MKVLMKAFVITMSILFYCNFAISAPLPSDQHYCLGEPNVNSYSDVVVCFNLDTTTKWSFGFTTWSIHGLAWNAGGGFLSFSGAINTGIDQNGIPSYFIHFVSTLNQQTQKDDKSVVPYYLILDDIVIEQSKLGIIVSSFDRFNPDYVVGVSFRQLIMMNASLVPGECTLSPWKCWDVETGLDPVKVVRYAENDLPFLPPQFGTY